MNRSGDGSDWFNAVMVKELRQDMNDFAFSTGALLLLGFSVGYYALHMRFLSDGNTGAGTNYLEQASWILALGGALLGALLTGVRLRRELGSGEFLLLRQCGLRVGAIVRGKLYAGLALGLVLESLVLPMLLLSVHLKGVAPQQVGLAAALFPGCFTVGLLWGMVAGACPTAGRVLQMAWLGGNALWLTLPVAAGLGWLALRCQLTPAAAGFIAGCGWWIMGGYWTLTAILTENTRGTR